MNERKSTRTLAAAVALLALAAATARAAAVAGVVVSLEGHPQVQPAGKTAYNRLKLNDLVREGDSLKTGPGEKLGVAFTAGAEMRINENSVFVIQSGGGAKPASVMTTLGDAWARLISGHAGFQVRSPIAVAAVRGTEADIDVSNRMDVKVYEGLVDVMNDKGKTSLKAGQQSSVSGAGVAPTEAKAMAQADYRTWQNGLKPVDLKKSLSILDAAAVKSRTLELQMKQKDGSQKKVKLNFEKK